MDWVVLFTLIPIIVYIWGFYSHKEKISEICGEILDERYILAGFIIGILNYTLPSAAKEGFNLFMSDSIDKFICVLLIVDSIFLFLSAILEIKKNNKPLILENMYSLINFFIGIYLIVFIVNLFISDLKLTELILVFIYLLVAMISGVKFIVNMLYKSKTSLFKFFWFITLMIITLESLWFLTTKNKCIQENKNLILIVSIIVICLLAFSIQKYLVSISNKNRKKW